MVQNGQAARFEGAYFRIDMEEEHCVMINSIHTNVVKAAGRSGVKFEEVCFGIGFAEEQLLMVHRH